MDAGRWGYKLAVATGVVLVLGAWGWGCASGGSAGGDGSLMVGVEVVVHLDLRSRVGVEGRVGA